MKHGTTTQNSRFTNLTSLTSRNNLKVHCILSCGNFRDRVDVTQRHKNYLCMCSVYIFLLVL